MKLMGWMRHKIRQNSIEPFKDFTIGNYCACLVAQSTLDDQDCNSYPSFGSRCGSRSSKQPKQESGNSFSELETKGVEANFEEEATKVISELFHGFLAIGTLGSEKIISEPSTPTFPTTVENITEEKTEVTEYDLKVINDELEKFLDAEAEEESNESSRRNSYVSITTLCEKPIVEGGNAEDYEKKTVCPLQGYLFGSSIEIPKTSEVKKEKTSLAELFHSTKITEENSTDKCGKGEMQGKPTHKSVKHLIKKMLKKFHATSENLNHSDTNSVSNKKKLHKVIQIFHRKIHPENSIAEKEFIKFHRKKIKSSTSCADGYAVDDGGPEHLDKSNKRFPQGSKSKEGDQYYMTNMKWPQCGLSDSTSSGNREHWIKTDADYLVLEL